MAEKKEKVEKHTSPKQKMEVCVESLKLIYDSIRKQRDAVKGTRKWSDLHRVMERVKMAREEVRFALADYKDED